MHRDAHPIGKIEQEITDTVLRTTRGNKIKTMRGANRLGIEALPLFPTVPTEDGGRTRGFKRFGSEITFSWPVWEKPIGTCALISLLAHPEIVKDHPDRQLLHRIGVRDVYRARRITADYYRNFTMGRPVAG
jgi:hypothetical protein